MKYLCLIYSDEKMWDTMPKAEAEGVMKDYFAYSEDIRKSGHYIAGEALHSVQAATTIRSRNGKISTTDGPFAETKEQLGGFYLINARDLNEAIQVASRIPGVKLGSIEVRPVVDFSKENPYELSQAAAARA